jgi:hypothetical protein
MILLQSAVVRGIGLLEILKFQMFLLAQFTVISELSTLNLVPLPAFKSLARADVAMDAESSMHHPLIFRLLAVDVRNALVVSMGLPNQTSCVK